MPAPVPEWRQAAASAVSTLQWGLILAAAFGNSLARAAGWEQPPAPLAALTANRQIAFMGYFLLNFVAQQLVTTGAFEVYLDGAPLYSALASGGRLPSVQLVAQLLAKAGLPPASEFEEAIWGGGHGHGHGGGHH